MSGEGSSDTDSSLGNNDESGYEEMDSGRAFVPLFVAGLNGLKQCKLFIPELCIQEDITFLHFLFESQNEILASSMLGNEAIVRTIHSLHASPHDSYVLGCCISLSRCQWQMELQSIGDEHDETSNC